MANIIYQNCPLCGSDRISAVFEVIDRTVLQRPFEIWHCANCTGRFTQNGPDETDIGAAYISETYISHSNTVKGIVNRLYHLARKISLKQKRSLVEKLSGKSSGRLIEVGSGRGHFLSTMQNSGWTCTGFEASADARTMSAEQFGLDVRSPDALFGEPAASADVIALWHVLEHIHKLDENMKMFSQTLKDDGLLLIAVPNYLSSDARHYGADWAAWDAPRHLYHFSPEALATLAAKHGFQIVSRRGMGFDPFYVSLLSEKNRHGRTRLVSAFYRGLVSFIGAISRPERSSSVIYTLKKAGDQA